MTGPFREGIRLILSPLIRRILGIVLLIPSAVLLVILPEKVPAEGIGLGGPPTLVSAVAPAAFLSSILLLLFILTILSGKGTDSHLWLKHTPLFSFILGKLTLSFILPLLCTLPSFPVLLIAARLEGVNSMTPQGFIIYLIVLYSSYALVSEILNLLLQGRIVLRRIILWNLFLVQLITAARLAPLFSPAASLTLLIETGGTQDLFRPLILIFLIPLIIFIITAAVIAGRRRE